MNHIYEGGELNRIKGARESFSGRLLTDDQFDEAMAITGIVEKQFLKRVPLKTSLVIMHMPLLGQKNSTPCKPRLLCGIYSKPAPVKP
jgi:hypothetical protein